MVVLRVGLEVLGQGVDAAGDDRDLDLGRTRVVGAAAMFLDQFSLVFGSDRHRQTPLQRLNPRTTRRPPAEASTSATGRLSSVARRSPGIAGKPASVCP